MNQQKLEELQRKFGGPASRDEIEVLEDIKAFIDFGLRNGLSFRSMMTTLGHDINGLYRYGFDLEEAKKDAFLPQSHGYSQIDEDSVGEVEEPVESDQ